MALVQNLKLNKKRFDFFQFFAYAFLFAVGILLLYPLFYAIVASVTTQTAIETATKIFPKIENFWRNISNYYVVFLGEGLLRAIFVTFIRFGFSFIVSTFISVLLGYVFARMTFPFKKTLFMIFMASMMIPGVAMTVPGYIFMSSLKFFGPDGLVNNPLLYFVTGYVGVYNIFLCRQMISTLGGELKEAGEIDGASFLRIVFQLYMPLIKPVIMVFFVNSFVGHWSDYMTGLVMMSGRPEWQTIGYRVTEVMEYYVGSEVREFPKFYAVSIITMLPPVIVFLSVQKHFVEGLALGGVKG
jgi:ABC-type glycerol-3-phosphate transport system permease component